MRRFLGVLLLLAVAAALVLRAEPFSPTVSLEMTGDLIGRGTLVRILGADRGTGLAEVALRVVPASGGAVEVAHETYPRRNWRGSGIHSALVFEGTV